MIDQVEMCLYCWKNSSFILNKTSYPLKPTLFFAKLYGILNFHILFYFAVAKLNRRHNSKSKQKPQFKHKSKTTTMPREMDFAWAYCDKILGDPKLLCKFSKKNIVEAFIDSSTTLHKYLTMTQVFAKALMKMSNTKQPWPLIC